jgi:membrane associated rhomboid family serine protease
VFPLRDNLPTQTFPVVTVGLIVANTLVWLWELSKPGVDIHIFRDGYYPCAFSGPCHIPAPFVVHPLPWFEGIFTGMFMHASWAHIGFNMLFLWIFGIILIRETPAVWFLGAWIALQIFTGGLSLVNPSGGGGTAFFAHIGGFAFGAATILLVAKRRPSAPTSRYPVY